MPTDPASPLPFACGARMKNRFMLAPLTNTQSHPDGTLSDDEYRWLTMRAEGQFGLVMTCAAHVQARGQGFPGQLGIWGDHQLPGHRRLAAGIQAQGALAVVQLHHAGLRAPAELIGEPPVSPSGSPKHGARALSLEEVEQLREDFLAAARRAQTAGYDGVEIHGAHGYILTQFLSAEVNQRTDRYGGSLANRARLLYEIVADIRDACGPDFLLGVRLSPERFGMKLAEMKTIAQGLIDAGQVDFLDFSLWDCFKLPEEADETQVPLVEHVAHLDFKQIRWTAAGKIYTGAEVARVLAAGADFVTLGRAGILHHDFPARVMAEPDFVPVGLPVTAEYLRSEGLGEAFINYMRRWQGFVG
ncbi:MAG: NADH:flavin oxidoreductase [Bacteroidetes bacterium]|nr:MAG: NADH:flavin oxidoreductase [Bacteroidota bacterium]